MVDKRALCAMLFCLSLILLIAGVAPYSVSANPIPVDFFYLASYSVIVLLLINYPINLFFLSLSLLIFFKSYRPAGKMLFIFQLAAVTFFISVIGAIVDLFFLQPAVEVDLLRWIFADALIFTSVFVCTHLFIRLSRTSKLIPSVIFAVMNPISWYLVIGSDIYNVSAAIIISVAFLILSIVLILALLIIYRRYEILASKNTAAEDFVQNEQKRKESLAAAISLLIVLFIIIPLGLPIFTHTPYQPPVNVSLSKDANLTNWTVTVVSILGDSSISISNVNIIIYRADDSVMFSRALSNMIPGTYYSGIRFHDLGSGNSITNGDYFTLDRNIYLPGLRFFLTDLDGTYHYGNVII